MKKLRISRFVTLSRQIIEPGIINQCGEIVGIIHFHSSISKNPNVAFVELPIELPQQDAPIRGITITFDY